MNKKLLQAGFIAIAFAAFSISFTGCKSKQSSTTTPSTSTAYQQNIEKAKRELLAIINDQGSMSLDEKEYRLNAVKRQNIQDREVQDLIKRAEDVIAALKADNEAKTQKETEKEQQHVLRKTILDGFRAVANASSFTQANIQIEKALKLYATIDVPVLIIISQENGVKDYDRPTTIKKYLEYLKDVKNFDKDIESFVLDKNGKITEIELIKK